VILLLSATLLFVWVWVVGSSLDPHDWWRTGWRLVLLGTGFGLGSTPGNREQGSG